jgi:hypothetical protein
VGRFPTFVEKAAVVVRLLAKDASPAPKESRSERKTAHIDVCVAIVRNVESLVLASTSVRETWTTLCLCFRIIYGKIVDDGRKKVGSRFVQVRCSLAEEGNPKGRQLQD